MIENHLEKLVTFVGVVGAGSIRKYAHAHNSSQPAVSQRIANLERVVGLPLLRRSREGVQLTKEGRVIYELGLKLMSETQSAEAKLYSDPSAKREMRFGTYDSVAIYLLPSVAKEVRARMPSLNLSITCGRSSEIVKLVETGALDLGLCMASAKARRLTLTPLYDDFYGFFSAPSVFQEQTLISVPDATDHMGKSIRSYVGAFGLDIASLMGVPSFEVAKAMTIAGLGIGVLPHRVAAPFLKQGVLRRAVMPVSVPTSFGLHSFGLITRKSAPETSEFRLMRELFVTALAKHA